MLNLMCFSQFFEMPIGSQKCGILRGAFGKQKTFWRKKLFQNHTVMVFSKDLNSVDIRVPWVSDHFHRIAKE